MTININNHSILSQLDLAKDGKTNEASSRSSKLQQASEFTAEISANSTATRFSLSDSAKFLQQLEEVITKDSGVDTAKVAAVVAKMRDGKLAILHDNVTERLQSAENIAQKLLQDQVKLPDFMRTDN